MNKRWTTEEDRILDRYYDVLSRNELLAMLPDRTWEGIKQHAAGNSIRRSTGWRSKGDPTPLLSDTLEAYYWVGYLIADGSFSNNGRMIVHTAIKDVEHLEELARILGLEIRTYSNHGFEVAGISLQHPAIHALKDKFGITNRKTYEPPDMGHMTGDNLTAFIIGFIDGDGTIRRMIGRRDCQITIKCHAEWLNNLSLMGWHVYKTVGLLPMSAKINAAGYAQLTISNSIVIRYLAKFAHTNHLPVLYRKWDKIDIAYISKVEIAKHRVDEVRRLLNAGYSKTEIAKSLGISNGAVTMIIKRNNIDAYVGYRKKEVLHD